MFDYCKVDGIMIGRASLGNPWIFESIIDGIDDENYSYTVSKVERLNTILDHIDLAVNEKGEYVGIREMRKHISGYTKNLPNSSEFREKMNRIENKNELIEFITEYIQNI